MASNIAFYLHLNDNNEIAVYEKVLNVCAFTLEYRVLEWRLSDIADENACYTNLLCKHFRFITVEKPYPQHDKGIDLVE